MTGYDDWLLRQADKYMSGCLTRKDKDGEYTKCLNCFDKCEQYYELFDEEENEEEEEGTGT